ncbi:MAG: polyprenyl synthetase family protein [Halobacteriales archaeon]
MRELLESWRPEIDAAIEEVLPRTVDEEYLATFFGEPTYRYDAEGIDRALADPVWELLDRGGKRWRVVLFLLFVGGFGEDEVEAFLPYGLIPEILHTGTIIVDDVEDGATKRRGGPAIHLRYGHDVALNAGNALYFLPLKIITHNPGDLDDDTRLRAYEMLMHELNRTHLGQGMDIWWHNEPGIRATPEEYLEMTACKTGCLARIVARLAAILTDQPVSVEATAAGYAEAVAMAFQISDDILDVEHTLDQAGDFGKAFGNDIREGKTTLMAIHTAREATDEDRERLEAILAKDDNTDEEVLEAIELYERYDSVAYARETAADLADRARDYLEALDLEPAAVEHIEAFTDFVLERDH